MAISLRKSINEKCKDCTYDPMGEGNWRQQVGDCRVKVCALWPIRPVSKPHGDGGKAPQEAISGQG